MHFVAAALALPIGLAVAQGVTSAIAPPTSPPAGCSPNYNGKFQIEVVNATKSAKRDEGLQRRADGELIITLANGVLTDDQGRTGYIAANQQFQFDGPAQTGAIYTAGWSSCANGSLAIGGDAVFYQCLSGTFYNLYDNATEEQCSPIYIDVVPYGVASSSASAATSATSAAAAAIINDGQVTAQPVTQISDGQPQATTAKSAPVVHQTSDGQLQVTTWATSTSSPSSSSWSATPTPTSTTLARPVSVLSDGQPQAPTGRNSTLANPSPTTSPVTPYTGGAASVNAIRGAGLAVGLLAIAFL